MQDILIPLIAVAIAELGDKSQLLILLLASRVKKRLRLLFGIVLAFFIVDGVAILAGSWITTVIPISMFKIISGIIFIIIGILLLIKKEPKDELKIYSKNSFLSGFLLIFLAEWGDKTQIASALFAAQYNALMVLIGVMLALTFLSILTIYFGKLISNKINKKVITKIAGVVFIGMGILSVLF